MPDTGRALGLDLGARRIGVAVSDDRRSVATPLEVVSRRDAELARARIAELVDEWEVTIVVVGVPLHLSGGRGQSVRHVMREVDRLRATIRVPIVTYDERLTTVTAQRSLNDQNIPARKQREMIDMVAAQVILQGWLDKERT